MISKKHTLLVKCWWNKPNWCIFRNPISGCDIWQHPLMIISIPIFTSFHIFSTVTTVTTPIRWPIRQPCHGGSSQQSLWPWPSLHPWMQLSHPAWGYHGRINDMMNIAAWWWYTYLPLWKMMEFVSLTNSFDDYILNIWKNTMISRKLVIEWDWTRI